MAYIFQEPYGQKTTNTANTRAKSSVEKNRPEDRAAADFAMPLFEESYRILFDTMSQGVIFRDREGRIVSVNPAAERILGRKSADLIGKTSVEVHGHALQEDGTRLSAERSRQTSPSGPANP